MSEVRDNTFNIQGRINNLFYSVSPMRSDVIIDGNTFSMGVDGTGYNYDAGGPYHNSGRSGFNFACLGMSVPDGESYKVYVTNNNINALRCTTRNKHFVSLRNKNLEVVATGNHLQKFKWLRYVNKDVNFTYANNYDEKGNLLNKEDWYFDKYSEDTPAD